MGERVEVRISAPGVPNLRVVRGPLECAGELPQGEEGYGPDALAFWLAAEIPVTFVVDPESFRGATYEPRTQSADDHHAGLVGQELTIAHRDGVVVVIR